jgi:hypothetical protein
LRTKLTFLRTKIFNNLGKEPPEYPEALFEGVENVQNNKK